MHHPNPKIVYHLSLPAITLGFGMNVHLRRVPGVKSVEHGTSESIKDYIGKNQIYSPLHIQRRFRDPREMFFKMRDELRKFVTSHLQTSVSLENNQGVPTYINILV